MVTTAGTAFVMPCVVRPYISCGGGILVTVPPLMENPLLMAVGAGWCCLGVEVAAKMGWEGMCEGVEGV